MKNVTIPSQFLQELLALCGPEDHELRERVLKSAAPAHPADGVPAQGGTPGPWRVRKRTNDVGEVLDCFVTAPDCQGRAYDAHILGDDYDSIDLKLADAELVVAAVNAFRATAAHPTQQGLEPVKLLAKDHANTRVDYSGLLGKVQREMKRSAPGYAEMIRQLQGHLQELGQRWYAGQTEVVDELLQLYCIESEARKAIAAQAKQGEQANG